MQQNTERAYYNDIAIPAQNVEDPIVPGRHSHVKREIEVTFVRRYQTLAVEVELR
jgi:hypothetical protein